jgi:hypothetical protein
MGTYDGVEGGRDYHEFVSFIGQAVKPSEFLPTDPEVLGSIPGVTRFSE